MTGSVDAALSSAIDEVERVRRNVQGWKCKQVRAGEQLQLLKALALSWFKSWRPTVESAGFVDSAPSIDACFQRVLDGTGRSAARTTYLTALKGAKAALIRLRSEVLVANPQTSLDDTAPDFSPLAADPRMQEILARRWLECQRCKNAGAHLAATVMMGGLLEALFVARANTLTDKSKLTRAKSAPVNPKTSKALDLRGWTLGPYIDVAFELGWITKSGKDVATVLRDYRNYVHPEKERAHGIALGSEDSNIFWELTKNLARQLLS